MEKERSELSDQEKPLEVLVVDDEPAHAEAVAGSLERIGAESIVVHSEKEALEKVHERFFDVVVTDLMLETNESGLRVLEETKKEAPETEVIVMTAYSGIETAVDAMRNGAFNYLQKPLDLKQLRTIVEKAGESARLRRINRELKQRLDEKFGFGGVVGNCPLMIELIERLKRVSPTDATVLILGETGTGKELFAQALHQNSPRKNKPFVALNCAALSESLLEDELFGHVKGAYTGATTDRMGKIEFAQGGTLFLDEVGDMPLQTQSKLLRVLEECKISRVGANEEVKVDVRLISATNRNLEDAIKEGTFRMDLYHRLKVIQLRIPSLKERSTDIPILLDHFIKIFSKHFGKPVKGISQAARRRLFLYDWPGNVRQLKNTVESMVAMDLDGILDVDDLPEDILSAFPENGSIPANTETPAVIPLPADQDSIIRQLVGLSLEDLESRFIKETLNAAGGNREETAKMLGIGERTLYRKIKENS
ncbi:MAG: sigma-54 dependent transcriptional regulator [Planctomycetia bacterium]|nr:sigma-54 dependent transcriptional regulator [Planctomycetia bacterium]